MEKVREEQQVFTIHRTLDTPRAGENQSKHKKWKNPKENRREPWCLVHGAPGWWEQWRSCPQLTAGTVLVAPASSYWGTALRHHQPHPAGRSSAQEKINKYIYIITRQSAAGRDFLLLWMTVIYCLCKTACAGRALVSNPWNEQKLLTLTRAQLSRGTS